MAFDDSGFFGTQDLGPYGGTGGGSFGIGDAARISGGLGDLASIAAGLFAGNKRRNAAREVPGLQEALNAAMAARTYASAAADPQSAWFKNLAALFREAQTRHAIEGIGALRSADARAAARGRPLINPERRDTAYAQGASRAFANAELQSSAQAREALMQAAQGSAGAAGAFTAPNALSAQYGSANDAIARSVPLMWQQAGRAARDALARAFPKTLGELKPGAYDVNGLGGMGGSLGMFGNPNANLDVMRAFQLGRQANLADLGRVYGG